MVRSGLHNIFGRSSAIPHIKIKGAERHSVAQKPCQTEVYRRGESRVAGVGGLGIDASERGGETEGGCSRTMSWHGGVDRGKIDSQVLLTL